MNRWFVFVLTLAFPLSAFGHGSDSGLASKLGICEKMKENREKIEKAAGSDKISNRCRQALNQVEECYRAREATKSDSEKLQGLGEAPAEGQPRAGMNTLGLHSAESLNMGRERYTRNSEMCRAIRDNVRKQCRADSRDLSREHDRNYNEYLAQRGTDLPRAQEYLEVAGDLQKQMRANTEAEKAAVQGLTDESACNDGYENIYTAYAAGADNSLQLAAANGDLSSNQSLSAVPTDENNHTISGMRDDGIKGTVTEKAVELAHGGVIPAIEHGLPAAGQVALKSTGSVFPVLSAVHGDGMGAATGAVQTAGEMMGSSRLASLGLGAGVFTAVYFYQDPNFMRCDGIYTDPVQAARAGNCPLTTAGGAMSTQSAVRTLSGE